MKRKTYTNENIGVSFSLPETMSTRDGLDLRARLVEASDENAYIRWWLAVLPLLEDWQCDDLPDPAAFDLDAPATWRIMDIVQWVGNTTAGHMAELENVPKN